MLASRSGSGSCSRSQAPRRSSILLGLRGRRGSCRSLFVCVQGKRRVAAFEDQLPDLLISIAASLKAGHWFRQGIQAVVDEGAEPAAQGVQARARRVAARPPDGGGARRHGRAPRLEELRLHRHRRRRSRARSAARSPGLFDIVADTVRQRQQFARKIKALTAMGRMSAYVLIGLPFFIAAALTLLNPSYMSPLFHTPHGPHADRASALVMMAIGVASCERSSPSRGDDRCCS